MTFYLLSITTCHSFSIIFFFFNDTATTEIYTLSLHDALPICTRARKPRSSTAETARPTSSPTRRSTSSASTWLPSRGRSRRRRSEEHTSELQSPCNLVCRLLLEKKKPHYSRFT